MSFYKLWWRSTTLPVYLEAVIPSRSDCFLSSTATLLPSWAPSASTWTRILLTFCNPVRPSFQATPSPSLSLRSLRTRFGFWTSSTVCSKDGRHCILALDLKSTIMALCIDPRGDLPPPIISSRSYHARPDSTLSQHSHRRVATYGYPPATYPKKKPCYDWIFSTASNAHVAIDRSSFKEYVSFKSHILAVANQHHVPVKGVGTVELKVRRQPGGKESHKVLLENVLHVPSWLCNIISDTCFIPAKDYDHTWTEFGISFEQKEDGK